MEAWEAKEPILKKQKGDRGERNLCASSVASESRLRVLDVACSGILRSECPNSLEKLLRMAALHADSRTTKPNLIIKPIQWCD